MKLHISEPTLISMGPDSRTAGWGPYQFPDLFRLSDGRILCAFNDCLDSEVAYGTERKCFVSADRGATWQPAREKDFAYDCAVELPNGDRIRFDELPSLPLGDIDISDLTPINPDKIGYKETDFYWTEDISRDICHHGWLMQRFSKEHPEGAVEEVTLNWPCLPGRADRSPTQRQAEEGTRRKCLDDPLCH